MISGLPPGTGAIADPLIEITVPVYNEERIIESTIEQLRDHVRSGLPFRWRFVIVDNASTDRTLEIAESLAERYEDVSVIHLDVKGRGRALRASWMASSADVVGYVDADLSTGLTGLLPLVAPLVSRHSDLAIGSRLSSGASVARGPRREIVSRLYNLVLRLVFAVRFRDAQCGFKAVRTGVAHRLLPAVVDEHWFFDTELLLLAEHNGLRIHEVPVDWVDDPDSRVDVVNTALGDLRGVRRMVGTFLAGRGLIDMGSDERTVVSDDLGRQAVTFSLIGLFSTVATLAIFLALRVPLGAVTANAIGFTVITFANFWAHRRFTFGRRNADGRGWHILGGVLLYLFSLSLATIGLLVVGEALGAQIGVLIATWALAAVVRFVLMRSWVYRR